LEHAVECRLEGRVRRLDRRRSGYLGQQAGGYGIGLDALFRRRRVLQHQAAEGTAIGRAALGEAREAGGHLPPVAIDSIAQQKIGRAHRAGYGLAIEAVRLEPGYEGGRAELVTDE